VGQAQDLFADGIFLGTTRPDGRPHATGIGAVWLDGDTYVTSGPGTRKSYYLAANPVRTISTERTTIDIALEGEAGRVIDGPTLDLVADRYREGGGLVQAEGDALTGPYNAPSAGPVPWHSYRSTFHTSIGNVTTEPEGATRWRFEV
jgi:hypothetical protein